MTMTKGGCACGAVRYEFTGDPLMMAQCQCRTCQHCSGTGHSSNVAVSAAAFKLTGPVKYWESKADSGNLVARGFCMECGSPVTSKIGGMANMAIVPAASLDDPSPFKPGVSVWAVSAQPWDTVDPSVPKFDRMPPGM